MHPPIFHPSIATVHHFLKTSLRAFVTAGLIFLCHGLAFPATPDAMPKVARTAAPAWVKPQPPDLTNATARTEQTGDGIRTLLADEQENAREDVSYNHYARLYLSQSGVEDESRLSISFDPAYQTLALNKLILYRNGKKIDRLARQEIKLLHREEGLDRLQYDGRFSAMMILEDIRIGDILEYAYTIRGTNPIFEKRYMDTFSTRWGTPVDRFYNRLIWPADRKITFKSFVENFPPAITPAGPNTEYVWEKNNVPPLASDGDLPSSFDPYAWVQISEFQSWADVARWACKLMAAQETDSKELREAVDAIRPITDRKKQAMAALHFVQDNIRYLGIEVGAHSHKPYPIATVMQRRFGDCKDKALLLCAILRRLGFEAYPALVETDYRETIAQWLPTALAFNHCVTQLRLDGHVYWLDPTRAHQGGTLDDIFFPDYGEALVVKEDTTSLTKIAPQGFDLMKTEVTEFYEFPDFKGNATLKVHTIVHGRDAEGTRAWLSDTSMDEMKKEYLNFYAKQFPHIETAADPVSHDDLEKNEIIVDESYKISQFWQPHADKKERLYGEFYPQIFRDRIHKPGTTVRTMPFAISFPSRLVHTIRATFPKDIKFKPEKLAVNDDAFKFSCDRSVKPNQVTLRYSWETQKDRVEAGRIADYLKNVNQVLDNLDYEIWIGKSFAGQNSPAPTPAEKVEAAPSPVITPALATGDVVPQSQKWLVLVVPGIFAAGIALFLFLKRPKRRPAGKLPPPIPPPSLHRCNLCGKTEHTSPELEFRVAMDGEEYCYPHLPKVR